MTGQTAANIIVFGDGGLWLVAGLLGLKGLRAQYLLPAPHGFALRRPRVQCAMLGLVGLLCLLLPLMEASTDLRLYGAVRPDHRPFLWAFTGIGLAGALLFLWGGRPQELVLDEDRHTYRHHDGWPPFQRVRPGPWSDLEGIWAEAGTDYGRSYLVYVRWRHGVNKMVVGRFESSDGADHFADELASVLGVPGLPPPSLYRPRGTTDLRVQAGPDETHTGPAYRRGRRWRRPDR